jgi:hypothetical protein
MVFVHQIGNGFETLKKHNEKSPLPKRQKSIKALRMIYIFRDFNDNYF